MIFKWELGPDEIRDMGYSEFVCRPELAEELLDGGMHTVNGRDGFLRVIFRYENAVHLKWTPKTPRVMASYVAEPMIETAL